MYVSFSFQCKVLTDAYREVILAQAAQDVSTSATATEPVAVDVEPGPVDDSDLSGLSAKRRLIAKITQEKGIDETSSFDTEINNYLSYQPCTQENDNAMLFWRTYEKEYPHLNKLARFYLSISARSVPVQAIFSVTGMILNGKRSSLSPAVLNYCTFVHDNYSIL
jgi:hAT family C-terminal dimerisation region